eukprot:10711996-Alexandrium_andersonii.AAC.1
MKARPLFDVGYVVSEAGDGMSTLSVDARQPIPCDDASWVWLSGHSLQECDGRLVVATGGWAGVQSWAIL